MEGRGAREEIKEQEAEEEREEGNNHEELSHGHEHGEDESGGQDNEDPSDVLHPEGAGLLTLLLWTAVSSPPLLLHHVQLSFLLKLQDGNSNLCSLRSEPNSPAASGSRDDWKDKQPADKQRRHFPQTLFD
ncbi:hypothetical protein EYF80_012493 [Liparis tanakae]|uniref:Uncharacterized protein n=1 Tax=Liparis tanakae TaxID=230148 RepID=A0A4Z2IH67_9TELE|nr:hypothetical protein EYF80_012493 [Liparis tanakae]